jgi:hypothetical protein
MCIASPAKLRAKRQNGSRRCRAKIDDIRASELHPFSTARRESVVYLSCRRLAIGTLSTVDTSLMAEAADDEGTEVIEFTNASHKEGSHACGRLRICPGRFIPPQNTRDSTFALLWRCAIRHTDLIVSNRAYR